MALPQSAVADEGWVIRSFGASYTIRTDGSIDVIEDLLVDFDGQQKHGIFRDIPVVFAYQPGPGDPDYRKDPAATYSREYKIDVRGVTDGEKAWPYKTSREGANFRIQIGDPDKTISGQQRYVITYRLRGALNSYDDHEELFWNITGDQWPVVIERASAVVGAPSVTNATCFEGPPRSTALCDSGLSPNSARFNARRTLNPGDGLTVVVALAKGSVEAPPPILTRQKTDAEKVRDFVGLKPVPIALSALVGLVAFGAIGRIWWTQGRDRWYGDAQYLSGAQAEDEKPLMARETVVVEYTPPEVGATKRPLRPAELGVLVDERADTLDVSATIVDLAVRGYLKIIEQEDHKFALQKLRDADAALLPYEKGLHAALFKSADADGLVETKDLEDHFYSDLAEVKTQLYQQSVKEDGMFAANPNTVRTLYRAGGFVVAALGLGAGYLLGGLAGAAIVALPLILAGLAVAALAGAMPRRTASGRELYRRARGFEEYMVTAETDRQKFNEEINLFEKYLPYAMVFECTEKWAKAFQGLDRQPDTSGWYASPNAFTVAAFSSSFAHDINSFSSSISSVMASTPSSSGGSGFGGGGSSGGGGGGGGGGSW